MTDRSVHRLVADLRQDVRPVGKHNKADQRQGGYAYQGIEDIIAMLTPLLEQTGLVLRSELEAHDVEAWDYQQNKRAEAHTVRVRYTWLGPAGDELLIGVFGGCAWEYQGDKGLNKAMTAARKLMLREHLLLSTDEDVDPERDAPPERPAKKPSAKPKKPAAEKPHPRDQPTPEGEPFEPTTPAEAKKIVLSAAGGDDQKARLAWETAKCDRRGWTDPSKLDHAITLAADPEWPF